MDSQTKQEIIKLYKEGKTAKEISTIFPYHNATISKMLRAEGVSRGRISKKRLDVQQSIISDFINKNMYCKDLAKKYNIHEQTVYRILDEAQIKRKTGYHSNCQENYFENIDTPNKAYLLGFITADGAVVNDVLSIEVKEEDKEVLNFARTEINPNATLTPSRGCIRVCFSAKQLAYDLKRYGIIQNKSKILERVPIEFIPKELLPFYFRGLIDGDGSISENGRVSIYSGSKSFIEDVQKILIKEINLSLLKIYQGTTYFISWNSKSDREKLFNYLYKDLDRTYYYKRKHARLKKCVQVNTEVTS